MSGTSGRGAGAFALARRVFLPLTAVGVATAIFGLPHVRAIEAQQSSAYVADPEQCELERAPAWFGADVEADVRAALAALPPQTLRDDAAVEAFAASLARSCGWIRSVDRAAKRYPNRLELGLTLRRPVALVEGSEQLWLADAEGVLVAPVGQAAEYVKEHDLPIVHSAGKLAGCASGRSLADRAVLDGLAVAREIAPFRTQLQGRDLDVVIIDVAGPRRAGATALSEVDLYTRTGLAIEWGRARSGGRLGALEPAPDAKIRGLLNVAARRSGMSGVRCVRLQFTPPAVVNEDPNGPEASLLSRLRDEN